MKMFWVQVRTVLMRVTHESLLTRLISGFHSIFTILLSLCGGISSTPNGNTINTHCLSPRRLDVSFVCVLLLGPACVYWWLKNVFD